MDAGAGRDTDSTDEVIDVRADRGELRAPLFSASDDDHWITNLEEVPHKAGARR